jgi:hypothetical protein
MILKDLPIDAGEGHTECGFYDSKTAQDDSHYVRTLTIITI